MPGYATSTSTIRIGGEDYRIRGLVDRRQYSDPDGAAEAAGVAPSNWPHFGTLWPAGVALAEEMCVVPIAGRRILEAGCGLGLSSLVLRRRGADVTASDHHPLAREFLSHNGGLNGIGAVEFRDASWSGENASLGRFDLIVGADLLYERSLPVLLAGFVARHAMPDATVILADPGRGNILRFRVCMTTQGFSSTERAIELRGDASFPAAHGRLVQLDRREARAGAGSAAPAA